MDAPDGTPTLLTIEEAAAVLGIGRSSAYALTRLWDETGGRAGLASVRVGRSLRVRAADLERLTRRPLSLPERRRRRGSAVRGATTRRKSSNSETESPAKVNDSRSRYSEVRDDQVKDDRCTDEPSKQRVQQIPNDPVDTCHPCGEAGSAPAGGRARRPGEARSSC